MVRKDAWNDFYFFEFTKARFMAQDVIYPGEGSMCTSEKCEIHFFAPSRVGGEQMCVYVCGGASPVA